MPPLDDEHFGTWIMLIMFGAIVLMCLGMLVMYLLSG